MNSSLFLTLSYIQLFTTYRGKVNFLRKSHTEHLSLTIF